VTEEEDDDDDDPNGSSLKPIYASGTVGSAYWETCRAPSNRHGARAAIFLAGELSPTDAQLTTDVNGLPEVAAQHDVAAVLSHAVSARVYHLASVNPSTGAFAR
jgi:hypothetical protein